jgi:hypothetical protein
MVKVESLQPTFEALSKMRDLHCAFRLLAACCGTGLVQWVMRTVPPSSTSSALNLFDIRVRRLVEGMGGFVSDNREWAQAALAVSVGGLGLRSAAAHADAAYIASRTSTSRTCMLIDPLHIWDGDKSGSALAAALTSYNAAVGAAKRLDPARPPDLRQRDLGLAVDAESRLRCLASASDLERARLLACAAPHAGAWLVAPPDPGLGLWIDSRSFRTLLCMWLGIPLGEAGLCSFCAHRVDALGSHALECTAGHAVVRRHNALREVIYHTCQEAGLRPEAEKPALLPESLRRPADIFLPRWPGGGSAMVALDIAVVSPLQRRYLAKAGVLSLATAEAYADYKAERADCESRCREQGVKFEPIVAESFGGWCSGARRVFTAIAKARALSSGMPDAASLELLYQQLSVALQTANARSVLERAATRHQDLARAAAAAALSAPQVIADDALEEERGLEPPGLVG